MKKSKGSHSAHVGEMGFKLVAPYAVAIYTTDNDCAVFIHNANALSVRIPLHVTYYTFVTIVDHLLCPLALHGSEGMENRNENDVNFGGILQTYVNLFE